MNNLSLDDQLKIVEKEIFLYLEKDYFDIEEFAIIISKLSIVQERIKQQIKGDKINKPFVIKNIKSVIDKK